MINPFYIPLKMAYADSLITELDLETAVTGVTSTITLAAGIITVEEKEQIIAEVAAEA